MSLPTRTVLLFCGSVIISVPVNLSLNQKVHNQNLVFHTELVSLTAQIATFHTRIQTFVTVCSKRREPSLSDAHPAPFCRFMAFANKVGEVLEGWRSRCCCAVWCCHLLSRERSYSSGARMGERGCGDSQGRDQGEEMQPLYKGYNLITQLMAALESLLIEVFFLFQ